MAYDPVVARRQEVDDNILNILRYSNATVFKCYSELGFHCSFCKDIYPNPEHLKYHNLDKHADEIVLSDDNYIKLDITDLKCLECDKNLISTGDLINHLKLEHSKFIPVIVDSPIISYKFDSDVHNCMVCSDQFQNFQDLEDHMQVHFKSLECDECHKLFIDKASLTRHIHGHDAGMTTTTTTTTTRTTTTTTWTSTLTKTFTCVFCDEGFNTYASCEQHEIAVHMFPLAEGPSNEADEENLSDSSTVLKYAEKKMTYKCHKCLSVCENMNALKDHIRKCRYSHLVKCDMCDMELPKMELLDHKNDFHRIVQSQ